MLAMLQKLRQKVAIGYVGGSDLVKQQEQLGVNGLNGTYLHLILSTHVAESQDRHQLMGSLTYHVTILKLGDRVVCSPNGTNKEFAANKSK